MIKKVRSWSKDSSILNLIGKKKVDWSVFEYGSHIPIEFHIDFIEANGSEKIEVGKSKRIQLIFGTHTYDASLSNIDQRSANREALQLRYDSNKELKALMMSTFKSTYDYIAAARSKSSGSPKAASRSRSNGDSPKEQIKVPDEQAEYIEFYATGVPYRYEIKFITGNTTLLTQHDLPGIWWVNQGATLSAGQAEGNLWAPLKASNGRAMYHWDTMDEVKVGDIILHYANGALRSVSQVFEAAVRAPKPASFQSSGDGWEQEGRLVRVQYHALEPAIPLQRFSQALIPLDIDQGPIHTGGGVKQGYLFRFTLQAMQIIQARSADTAWPDFTKLSSVIDPMKGGELVEMEPIPDSDVASTVQIIQTYIRRKGFQFPDHLIENFYLSLKTKPFVILAGVSGTGKTKLVKLFAEALGATSTNRQFTLIPVRPDWSDPSDLLGYKDLSGAFRPGRLTEVLLEATKPSNRHKPYFICLDEMNLARVEHYFSDLLSVLETQEWHDGRIMTASLIGKESLTTDQDQQTFGNMYLPDNVYLVGTVNMDETTHPFSKKVLDRANTIEFNYINLAQYPDEALADDDELATQVSNSFLRSDYLQLVDVYGEYRDLVHRTTDMLVKINTILEEIHSHVGFRIRDAICFYLIYNERFQLLSEDAALDMQLLQKILPRIQGSGGSVKRALLQLMEVALDKSLPIQKMMDDPTEPNFKWNAGSSSEIVRYPQSARKIAFMLRRLEEDGFTSYWLS
ncbi:AAA domain (dynein-related subfamily) [Paenibacillus tianmuensis]|uniref:AAA domain (Dynein-related subfamily) n=1 Tax=Paenibacillus tianmuensis TaxID=624147 RepID=A0A1G4SPT6_9BACL|nr:AAA family ATPase [Paenibacillus tianmuensis]SCW71076.1 AAA domain (dynein-related subfamily) [Paenibacillus tianmuensis]